MTKLDWDKAKQRKRSRGTRTRPTGALRERALDRFVTEHHLVCFVCRGTGRWAKTGISARGPWAICSTCVEHQSG